MPMFTGNNARRLKTTSGFLFPRGLGVDLGWYLGIVRLVDPSPLGKPRSRDVKDDPYLAAALAGRSEMIVTYDQDLLVLGKPFGIAMARPFHFLKEIQSGDE
jgi:hypothetical protein